MKFLPIILIFLSLPIYASANQIIDQKTNSPIANAKITIPQKNITTYTDENGRFDLKATFDDDSIISVEKEGYRPFSLTVNDQLAVRPLVIGIEKSSLMDIIIDTEMFHLGDDNFCRESANSGEFKGRSIGPFYSKTFEIEPNAIMKKNYLVIGSIIGIDSLMARSLNQNSITTSYATPPEVYFNGQKIAEIKLNGDNQKIRLPNNLVRAGMNEITIKTGHNVKQVDHIDYDDIEFMNLSVQTE